MSKIIQEFSKASLKRIIVDLMIGTHLEVMAQASQVSLPEHVRRVREKTDEQHPVRKSMSI